MITGSAFLVVLTLLSSKLKDINQPFDSINRRVEELKSQPAPLFKSKPETPTLVRRMQGFLGLNRYNTFEERYSDEIIQPSKPLPLKYLLYALLAVFLSLPLVLSVLDGDWSKLRLYWVIPMFLFGLALFLYAGGFAFSILVNIILIPLNIYFEHSTKPEPYLLFACKNLLKFDENDHILPFLGIIFWGCIAIFVNYDVKPLVFLHWLFRG